MWKSLKEILRHIKDAGLLKKLKRCDAMELCKYTIDLLKDPEFQAFLLKAIETYAKSQK